MTTTVPTHGGPAVPVSSDTSGKTMGRVALRAYGFISEADAIAAGFHSEAGPASSVYVVSAADLVSGKYVLEGDPKATPIYTAPAGMRVEGGYSQPVYLVGGSLSNAVTPVVPSTLLNSLVGYWKLDESSGNRLDSTVNGYTLAPSAALSSTTGLVSNAANFTAQQELTINSNTNLQTGMVDWSFACWYYHISGTGKVIATKTQISPSSAREWTLSVGNLSVFQVDIWNTSGGVQSLSVPFDTYDRLGLCVANSWNLIACGYKAATNKLWIYARGVYREATATVTVSATAAKFSIGSYSDSAAQRITGYVDEAGYWKKALTLSEIGQLSNGGKAITYPFTSHDSGPALIACLGDSLTNGYNVAAASSYPQQLSVAAARYNVLNAGKSGITTTNAINDAPIYVDPNLLPGYKNVVVVWVGLNDLIVGGVNVNLVHGNLSTCCTARRTAGFKVVVCTISPQIGNGTNVNFETDRQSLNALILANWHSYADAVADIGGDATIGQATSPNDSTYYLADKIHMTAAGYTIVAGIVNTALAGV